MGSVEDRVMREMIFRERQEKLAHLSAIGKMVALVGGAFGADMKKPLNAVLADYAQEVFQEAYDADMLRFKADALKQAQERIAGERKNVQSLVTRLDRMGEYYDRELKPDLTPVTPPTPKASRPPSRLRPKPPSPK